MAKLAPFILFFSLKNWIGGCSLAAALRRRPWMSKNMRILMYCAATCRGAHLLKEFHWFQWSGLAPFSHCQDKSTYKQVKLPNILAAGWCLMSQLQQKPQRSHDQYDQWTEVHTCLSPPSLFVVFLGLKWCTSNCSDNYMINFFSIHALTRCSSGETRHQQRE